MVAARASVEAGTPFSEILIADADQSFVSAAKSRLERVGANVVALAGAADVTIETIVPALSPGGLHFAFLDPYDLKGLAFVVIKRLAALERMDMLIHVSLQDLQRNLDRYIRSTSSPLDGFAPGWRKVVTELSTKADSRRKVLELRKARPMRGEWVDNVKRQCDDAGVAFFFKQWGAWGVDGQKRSKKENGRTYAGQVWDAMPV